MAALNASFDWIVCNIIKLDFSTGKSLWMVKVYTKYLIIDQDLNKKARTQDVCQTVWQFSKNSAYVASCNLV